MKAASSRSSSKSLVSRAPRGATMTSWLTGTTSSTVLTSSLPSKRGREAVVLEKGLSARVQARFLAVIWFVVFRSSLLCCQCTPPL